MCYRIAHNLTYHLFTLAVPVCSLEILQVSHWHHWIICGKWSTQMECSTTLNDTLVRHIRMHLYNCILQWCHHVDLCGEICSSRAPGNYFFWLLSKDNQTRLIDWASLLDEAGKTIFMKEPIDKIRLEIFQCIYLKGICMHFEKSLMPRT